jgi:hypothetical protein
MEKFKPKVGQRVIYRGGVITKVTYREGQEFPWVLCIGDGEENFTEDGWYYGEEQDSRDIIELIDPTKPTTFEEFREAGLLKDGMKFKGASNRVVEIVEVRGRLFYAWQPVRFLFTIDGEPSDGALSAVVIEE